MNAKQKIKPVIGCAFDPDQRNETENHEAYLSELTYYRPRGFSELAREGESILRRMKKDDENAFQESCEWQDNVCSFLSDWARQVERHDYIMFGPFKHGGAVGFYIYADGAIEDADLKVDDLSEVPFRFTGLVVNVTDHGNVSAHNYSRGRLTRTLFAIV